MAGSKAMKARKARRTGKSIPDWSKAGPSPATEKRTMRTVGKERTKAKEKKVEMPNAVPVSKGSKRNPQARKNRNAQRMGDTYAATGLGKKPGTSATKPKSAPAKPKPAVTRAKATGPSGGTVKKAATPKKSSVTLMTPAAAKKARQAKMDAAVKKGRASSNASPKKKKGGKNLKGYDSYKSFMG